MSSGYVIGRLYRDAEMKQIKEKDVCILTVACERKVMDKTYTDYVQCSIYGKEASQYAGIPKGTMICVENGRYSARAYESKGEWKASLQYNSFGACVKVLSGSASAQDEAPAPRPAPRAAAPAADDGDSIPF